MVLLHERVRDPIRIDRLTDIADGGDDLIVRDNRKAFRIQDMRQIAEQ